MDAYWQRPFLSGTSLEPAVISGSGFKLIIIINKVHYLFNSYFY